MATSKLTLNIEPGVIERAKKYARKQHISLSELVQQYLDNVSVGEKKESDPLIKKLNELDIPDYIKSVTGILKGKYPDDYNFKDEKLEYLKEKNGL